MLKFFAQAVDTQLTGSLAYLENLQRVFTQDQESGLIEAELNEESNLLFLYSEGQLIRGYQLSDRKVAAIDPGSLYQTWRGGDAPIRMAHLPSQAVRAAWLALEWYPPISKQNMASQALPGYLEKLTSEGSSQLLQFRVPTADGFVVWLNGKPAPGETIFSTPRGFETDLSILRGGLREKDELCEVFQYGFKPETTTYENLIFRLAVTEWVNGLLTTYQQMVGTNLLTALNYDINTYVRLKRWNIRLVGAILIDNHLFLAKDNARLVFRALLKELVNHISAVIGVNLAQRNLNSVFKKLSEGDQQILERNALLPSAIME